MAEFVIRVGSCTEQGVRPRNEDRFVVDAARHIYLVADGMGGHEMGERASAIAAEIIPRALGDHLACESDAGRAVQQALAEANLAIIDAGKQQQCRRRMGTTAVLAVRQKDQVFVAGIGDSRAYLIRGDRVEQLTVDHSVADELVRNGTLTAEQARNGVWCNVLYKFLGCAEMTDGAEVRPFTPEPGDRLVLATDGLTNHVQEDDLRSGAKGYPEPQAWADSLVKMALERGSRDNVTCVVMAFEKE